MINKKYFSKIIIIIFTCILIIPCIALAAPQNGWLKENGKWYYYKNGSAAMYKQTIDDEIYYFDPETKAMYANAWEKIGSSWYYFTASGKAARNGWYQLPNKDWYWFFSNGVMFSPNKDGHPNCCRQIAGKWHQFYTSGKWIKECQSNAHFPY